MAKKQFKAESKRLMDLMINSIYTNKEIFLREVISNASDAMDKLHYRSLTDNKIKFDKKKAMIIINIDKENGTLSVIDHGCGMTKDELETNLGTIAKSDSFDFKQENDKKKDIDIIGQFGVGFYSVFMVCDKVEVKSKAYGSNEAYSFTSSGIDGYTIEPCEMDDYGTEVILTMKKDTDEEEYCNYLDPYHIESLIKKYSDYITYPIKMEKERQVPKKDNKEEFETIKEMETINTLTPLWKRNKKDISDEDYNTFYSDKFFDYEKPLKVIHTFAEGTLSFQSLLYIPSHAPYDYYTKEYEKGLQLYCNGVLIMEKCSDLLPDYFSFVKGIVDSSDLPLNISRETLQQNRTLKLMAKNIENKIKKELESMLEENRESYEQFYKAFGMQLKFGIYNTYGMEKEKLQDLILFYSSKDKNLVTLKEYINRMPKEQDKIYYACGETIDKIDLLPQVEQFKDKNLEVLYLTEYVDEFTLQALREYDGKQFVNISTNNLDIDTKEEKEKIDAINKENEELLKLMKEAIQDVKEVRFTHHLKQHPVCLISEGNVSIEMEKVINAMPTDEEVKATTILEINETHPIANKLKDLYKNDKESLKDYSKILYAEARLIEGLPITNPTELSNQICNHLN